MATWMIVENEPDILDILLVMCELWGVKGLGFDDSSVAFQWLDDVDRGKVQAELPELAIVDCSYFRHVRGSKIAARIRQSPVLGNIAIVLTIAARLTAEQKKALHDEAQTPYLLFKPLPGFKQLKAILDEAVRSRPTERANGYPRPANR